jgi:hypothetical protein
MNFSADSQVIGLVEAFLDRSLPASSFDHQAHCVVTLYLLLRRGEAAVHLELPGLIRGFNIAKGGQNTDTAGYHETITRFYVMRIEQFRRTLPVEITLAEACNELLASPISTNDYILGFYSPGHLFSVDARREWLQPIADPT